MPRLGLSLGRLWHVAGTLTRHAAAHLLPRRLLPPWLNRRLLMDLPRPERLRVLFEELGGTFLKFGQMLALQPDILPLSYCNALFELLDRVPPCPMEDVERVMRQELGRGTAEVFEHFEPVPLASASIGQVHTAYLHGQKVAVKVQRPTVLRDFRGDIRLMEVALTLIRRLRLRRFECLVEPLIEFISWTEEELDYRTEARYMEQLRRNAQGSPYQHMPRVFDAYTTRRVLVVEFLDGVTVLDYLRAREREDEVTLRRLELEGFDPRRFATHLIDNFVHQVFVYGLFHADLHPANLMILPRNVVGYIDFGITGALSPFSRRHLVAMTLGYTRGDIEAMSGAFFQVSRVSVGDRAAQQYHQGLVRLSEDWYESRAGSLHLRQSFTTVMLQMLRLSRQTDVWAQRDVIKYLRSSIAIDGLLTRLVPGMDLGPELERACSRHLRGQAVAGVINSHNLLEWSATSARLMLASGVEAASLLDRLVDGDFTIYAESGAGEGRRAGASGWGVVVLGALVLALALLTIAGDVQAELGLNLFTAQLLLMAASLGRLVTTIRGRV